MKHGGFLVCLHFCVQSTIVSGRLASYLANLKIYVTNLILTRAIVEVIQLHIINLTQ